MKTSFIVIAFSLIVLPAGSFAQIKLKDVLNKKSSSGITENEAGQGIKEALTNGVTT